MRTFPTSVVLASAVMAFAACGGPGRTVGVEDPFTRDPVGENSVRLHVQNLRFNDARLYAVTPGRRHLIGSVTGKRDAAFSIPFEIDQPLYIEIDVLAGPRCRTPTLTVDPGETLDLHIQEDMERFWACTGESGVPPETPADEASRSPVADGLNLGRQG